MKPARLGKYRQAIVAWLVLTTASPLVVASESVTPLHDRIDLAIEKGNVAPVAATAGDGDFARRIYLHLAGRIPSVGEARDFLESKDPDKDAKLVDRLLGSPGFNRHMATTLDTWIMERRLEAHVKTPEWRKFLIESLKENKPYNQLVREVLSADGSKEKNRAAARFFLDREGEPHLMARDTGRIFFGQDLQCAQCHNHPQIDDYFQRDYYGMFAFFQRSSLFQPDKKKPGLLSEKTSGNPSFQSVFTEAKSTSLPRLPGGADIVDPAIKPGEQWKVKPDKKNKNLRPVPTYSRRDRLAELATNGSNQAFNRNIANRLWAQMMGRGLVEPLDFHHAANPPAHPELLDLLSTEFVKMKFDLRAFLRELALTRAYRRTIKMPDTLVAQAAAIEEEFAPLEAEAKRLAGEAEKAESALKAVSEAWDGISRAASDEETKLAAARKKQTETQAAAKKFDEPLAKAKAQLLAIQSKLNPVAEAEAKAAAAVKAVPNDQELAAAAATFKQRADQLRAEALKSQTDLAGKEKATGTERKKVEAAAAAVTAAQKSADTTKANLATATAELEKAKALYYESQTESRTARRRFENARDLLELARLRKAAENSKAISTELATELTGLENDNTAKGKLAADLDAANRGSAAAASALTEDAELARAAEVLRQRSELASAQAATARAALDAHAEKLKTARTEMNSQEEKSGALFKALTDRWTQSLAVAALTALTPEQLCHSMMEASGEGTRLTTAASAEFDKKVAAQKAAAQKAAAQKAAAEKKRIEAEKKKAEAAAKPKETNKEAPKQEAPKQEAPKQEAPKNTAAKPADKNAKPPPPPAPPLKEEDRAGFVENYLTTQTLGAMQTFIRLYGGQPGQPQTDFSATADQALFVSNNGIVRAWLRPNGSNLTGRLSKLESPESIAEELYLSVLTRKPSVEETGMVRRHLLARPNDKASAIQDMAWALMSSVEFRFIH